MTHPANTESHTMWSGGREKYAENGRPGGPTLPNPRTKVGLPDLPGDSGRLGRTLIRYPQVGFGPAVLVVAAFLLPLRAHSLELTGKTEAECAQEIRNHLAAGKRLPADTWANRFVAAALAEKVTFSQDGQPAYPSSVAERPFMIVANFQAIEKAARSAPLPQEYRDLLLKHIGGLYMYPIRQSPPRIGVRKWRTLLAGLPEDSKMATIGGAALGELIAAVYPGFAKLSWLQKKFVYDGLAAINPLVQPVGSYLADEGAGDGVPGMRRTEVGPELEQQQLQYILYEIDPETRLMPTGVVAANKDKPQGEALVVPVGGGKVRVCLYRIPAGARILLPPAPYLSRLARPDRLDLRNGWLRDLSVLDGLDPVELDLRGNDAAELAPLARMRKLRVLRLDNNPVTDLSPLKKLPLIRLDLRDTPVAELSPLRGMKLEHLVLRGSRVTDLTALSGMPIRRLDLDRTDATNLTPLAEMPLTYLTLNIAVGYESFAVFDTIPELANIGDVPRDAWFSEYERYQQNPGGGAAPAGDRDVKGKPPARKPVPKPKPTPKPEPKVPKAPTLDDTVDVDIDIDIDIDL